MVSLALALCAPDDDSAPTSERRGLNWPFLGATLVLLLAGYGTQQVAGGEDLRSLAKQNLKMGVPAPQIESALATDPGSARLWNFAARAAQPSDRATWEARFQKAIALQPDNAAHPHAYASQLASLPAPTPADLKQIDELYDRAVELDPLNSSLRIERGRWRFDHKDRRAFDDFAFVLDEWDAPYGKYPALGRDLDVNLDFARAVLALAPRLKTGGRLQPLVERAPRRLRTSPDVAKEQSGADSGGQRGKCDQPFR